MHPALHSHSANNTAVRVSDLVSIVETACTFRWSWDVSDRQDRSESEKTEPKDPHLYRASEEFMLELYN